MGDDLNAEDFIIISLNGSYIGDLQANITDFDIEPVSDFVAAVLAALDITESAARRGRKIKLAFCCSGGCGRTGTAYILYRILQGVPLARARKEFADARKCGPEDEKQELLLEIFDTIRSRYGVGAAREAARMMLNYEKLPVLLHLEGKILDLAAAYPTSVHYYKGSGVKVRDLHKLYRYGVDIPVDTVEIVGPEHVDDKDILDVARFLASEAYTRPVSVREILEKDPIILFLRSRRAMRQHTPTLRG